MNISVKELNAAIELKNKGMSLEIRDPKENLLGSLVVTGTGVIWCKGKTSQDKGSKITWAKFIDYMNADNAVTKAKPAKKTGAAKKAAAAPIPAEKAANVFPVAAKRAKKTAPQE